MQTPIVKKNNHIFLLLACLGIGLRLLFLGKNDLWSDEAFNAYVSVVYGSRVHHVLPLNLIPSIHGVLLNPPVAVLSFKYWLLLFGTRVSEEIGRLPFALCSIGSLFVAYGLAKRLFDKEIALITLFILAMNPLHLWYAQEGAPYAITSFLGLLSTYFLYRFIEEEKHRTLFLYVLFTTLALYTSYFSTLLYLSQIIFTWFFKNFKLEKL